MLDFLLTVFTLLAGQGSSAVQDPRPGPHGPSLPRPGDPPK